eukprot:Gb_15820 [translate_table: standard]
MYASKSVNDFFTKVQNLVSQMRSLGEDIKEGRIVEKILRCVMDVSIFTQVAASIEFTRDITTMKIDELNGILLAIEERSRNSNESLEQAFATKANIRGGRFRRYDEGSSSRGRKHNSYEGNRGRTQNLQRNNRGGYNFTQNYQGNNRGGQNFTQGYYGDNRGRNPNYRVRGGRYPQGRGASRGNQYGYQGYDRRENSSRGRVNTTIEENRRNENLFYTSLMAKSEEQSWYIDSGCSTHMTYNAKLFKEIKEDTEENKVVSGDNNTQEVKGKGVVSIKTETGETKNISDVLLVPGLKMNLLSVGQMMEQDYKLEFDNGECLIKDKLNKGKGVAKGELTTNRLFKLVIPPQPYVLQTTTTDESILWHYRYGHLNYGGLFMLRKNEMVAGLPFIQGSKEIYEGCIYGKQHREFSSVKIQGKRTFRIGTYRFMWTDENTDNGKSEILYDIYR